MPSNPSYITKRGPVYYFQYRMPSGNLIRKSLHTANRREALSRARKLWVKVTGESESLNLDRKYMLGRSISRDMEKEDITDPNSREFGIYTDNLQPFEIEALAYYDSHSSPEPVPAPEPQPQPAPEIEHQFQKLEMSSRGLKHSGILLSHLLEEFIKFRANKASLTEMNDTLRDYQSTINRLIMFIGDIPNEDITTEILESEYILNRKKLPTTFNRNKIYHKGRKPSIDMLSGKPRFDKSGKPLTAPVYKPLKEIIKLAKTQRNVKFPSDRSVYNEYAEIAAFFRHFEGSRGKIERGLGDFMASNQGERGETSVAHFTQDELTKIFNSKPYTSGELMKNPHLHWIPLIGIYQGMRIGEIAQLNVNNILEVDGIWCIQIECNIERGQKRKNKGSARIIPIHSDLLELGLLKYRDSQDSRLFPKEGADGIKTSQWFNNRHIDKKSCKSGFIEFCGVQKVRAVDGVERKRVFHSLRKSWSTTAKKLKLDYDARRELVGHNEGSTMDVHANDYEGKYEISTLRDELEKMKFDFDLSLIPKW